MTQVSGSYSFEIDTLDKNQWMAALNTFEDATFQQAWNYLDDLSGISKPVRVVLKKENQIVSMAQGKIIKLPFLPIGIAHFIYGPVWRLQDTNDDLHILHQMLSFMKKQFSEQRGLLLAIRSYDPHGFIKNSPLSLLFQNKGYHLQQKPFYRTILVDLSPSLDQLRKNLKAKWRRNLSKGERSGLLLASGSTDTHYQYFRDLHYEMFRRKHPEKWYNPDIDKEWRLIKTTCDERNRTILVAMYEEKPVAALILVALGNTGMNFFSATGDTVSKKKLHALYFLQWQAMVWLKENGFSTYDMRGYDPERFPGVSYFKSGLGGEDTSFAEYRTCESKTNQFIIEEGEKLIFNLKVLRVTLKEKGFIGQLKTYISKFLPTNK